MSIHHQDPSLFGKFLIPSHFYLVASCLLEDRDVVVCRRQLMLESTTDWLWILSDNLFVRVCVCVCVAGNTSVVSLGGVI